MGFRRFSIAIALAVAPLVARAQSATPDEFEPPKTRIVGGYSAREGSWPMQVALIFRLAGGDLVIGCGGTAIGTNWVLSAAHCFVDPKTRATRSAQSSGAMTGAQDLNNSKLIVANRIIPHPNYDPRTSLNDIALVELSQPHHVPRAILARQHLAGATSAGVMSTVIGWGVLGEKGNVQPHTLFEVDVPLVERRVCALRYGSDRITAGQICAGYQEGGKDSCQGDSGGPLFVRDRLGQPVQLGVVSWGEGCGRPGAYGVYTNVAAYANWIRNYVPDATFQTDDSAPNRPFAATDQVIASAVRPPPPSPPPSRPPTPPPYTPPPGPPKLTVDVLPGDKIKLASPIRIRIVASHDGELVVFNENAEKQIYLIYPNKFMTTAEGARPRTGLRGGSPMTLPGQQDGFELTVRPPAGQNRVFAFLLPLGTQVLEGLQPFMTMKPIDDPFEVIGEILEKPAARGGAAKIAVGERLYEITN